MRRLLNTPFVITEDAYLSLDGENVVVSREKQELARFPLHGLCSILSSSYAGASPAVMGACVQRDINLAFCTPRGRFPARTTGLTNDCASALESVELDADVGFMPLDRPGRASLAPNLVEELRPCLADCSVLTLINNRVPNGGDFEKSES